MLGEMSSSYECYQKTGSWEGLTNGHRQEVTTTEWVNTLAIFLSRRHVAFFSKIFGSTIYVVK